MTQSPSTGSVTLVNMRHIVPLQDGFSSHCTTPGSASASSPYPSSRSSCIRLSTRISEQLRISLDSRATHSEMGDSHTENIEDSQLSVNSELDAGKGQSDNLNQVREQEAQQYHEISNSGCELSPLSEGSSAEYMSEADISSNTSLVPLSLAEEELEGLLSDLELDSTSGNSNEPVYYCKWDIRWVSVVKDLENNLQKFFQCWRWAFRRTRDCGYRYSDSLPRLQESPWGY